MPADSSRTSLRCNLTLLVFFLSGFAALLYQVVWQRWLVFFTGISSASISLIVAVFMAGLGIGYLAGGALADRQRAPGPLRYFVLAELGIAVFGLCSKAILYDGLYASGLVHSTEPVKTCVVLLAVLFVPTFLMGLSLPLLAKSITLPSLELQAGFIGRLYFVNTLGAAAGALATGLLLVPTMGFHHATYVGAALNLTCAAVGALLYRQAVRSDAASSGDADTTTSASSPFRWTRGFTLWMIQYAVAGFAAISFELAWFRVLENTIKSLSQTFSILLAIYLLFLALGTKFAGRFAALKHEARARVFLFTQYMLYLWAAGSVALLFHALKNRGSLLFLSDYFRKYNPTWEFNIVLATYGLIPIFLMAVPTFLMGMSFTLSQYLVQDSQEELGRKVGWLQFANILGCVAATWVAPFVGFDWLGTAGLFQGVAALGIVYAILLGLRLPRRWIAIPVLVGLLVTALVRIPWNDRFWTVLGGMRRPSEHFFNENATGISMIKLRREGEPTAVSYCNGMGQSRLPYEEDLIHVRLGVIPSLLHPNPQEVAVIGLGSGGTLFGIGCRSETTSLTCFEVMTNEPGVLRDYGTAMKDLAVPALLDDPRTEFRFQDGREALQNESRLYDLIEADPPYPNRGFAGNLYSIEYFQLLKSRLKPDGLAVSWDPPSSRVRETFCAVFPYVYVSGKYILIGSNKKLVLDDAKIAPRLEDAFTKARLAKAGITMEAVIKGGLLKPKTVQEGTLMSPVSYNSDMFPKDEFVNPLLIIKSYWETGQAPRNMQ